MVRGLENKRIVVTAGAAGIGRAIAEGFHRAGARVHVCDVDESSLAALAADNPEIGRSRADVADPDQVARLFEDALAGGAQALGRPIGRLTPGARADLLVVDPERPNLTGRTDDLFLDALVFAGNDNPVTGVMVGGDWVVRDGRHAREDRILAAYKSAIAELTP